MHSPDRQWWWTGQQWVPALSPDRSHWWNGSAWVPVGPQAPQRFRYEPTVYTRRVQLTLLGWSVLRILVTVAVFAALMPSLLDQMITQSISNSAQSGQALDPAQEQQFRDFMRNFMTTAIAFGGVAAVAFEVILVAGILKLWRWVYWYFLVVFALGVLNLPVLISEIAGVGVYGAIHFPAWFLVLNILFLLGDLALLAWMVYLLRKFGTWARRKVPV
jgi:hypothetical protein